MPRMFMLRERARTANSPGLRTDTKGLIDHFRDAANNGEASVVDLLDVLRSMDERLKKIEAKGTK